MKKKILMIGNTSGLPGIIRDLDGYKDFFMSPCGGLWREEEIDILSNPRQNELLQRINSLKSENLEYLITIFSGHGAYRRDRTILEINEQEEIVSEADLRAGAKRQLLIFDCCRNVMPSMTLNASATKLSFSYVPDDPIRVKYERRIAQTPPQIASLYACSVGESAIATGSGSTYSMALIKAARDVVTSRTEEYGTVEKVHQLAADITVRERPEQHPDYALAKCLTSESLIISINPLYPT